MNTSAPLQKTATKPLQAASASSFLQRKCACGSGASDLTGECAECSKKKMVGLQTKIRVNEPGDAYEQEADRVADQVLAKPAHPGASSAPPRIQRYAGQSNGQTGAALPSVDRALASPGTPLEPALRHDMEQRFGHDFSRVRVHSGSVAEQSALDVNALAYTAGENIVFGAHYAPGTSEGTRLLAHELAHVIQQSSSASSVLMRTPDSPEVTSPPPVPKPGHTPFNFISESPALENWKISVKGMLEREFKMNFATFEAAQEHFQQYLQSLPTDAARQEFADRMRDRARKAFFRQEARTPSYAYSADEIARMRNGAAPTREMQLEHMEEVKSKVRGGKTIQGHPERALDPANIYITEGGPGGTAPTGTKHAEKLRTIEAAKKTSLEIRTGREPVKVEAGGGATPAEIRAPEPAVKTTTPVPEQILETVPADILETVPSVEVTLPSAIGKSAIKLVVAEVALNVILFVITYYFEKWFAEKQLRKLNNDLKRILPDINTELKSKEAEITEKANAFPFVYGNVTVVYTHDRYFPDDYNEGSMKVQTVGVSHQNFQIPEKLIRQYFGFEAYLGIESSDPTYSLTFSVPLFEEPMPEKGSSGIARHYRSWREQLRYPTYKSRLSAAIALYKLAKQDNSLQDLVVRDLLGLLKDEHNLVREFAAVSLSLLKAKIAIQYIREVIPIASGEKEKEIIERYLQKLEQP